MIERVIANSGSAVKQSLLYVFQDLLLGDSQGSSNILFLLTEGFVVQ